MRLSSTSVVVGWGERATIDQFFETSPGNNPPAKIRTTAFITYNDQYFYVGIRCDDPHPDQIRAPMSIATP